MGEQSASGYSVQVIGLDACLRVLTKAGAELHNLDTSAVRLSNSTLRAEAKQLADRFGKGTIGPMVAAYGGPQGPKMADTIRPKADRMPIVRIGAVNPKLSGFKSRRRTGTGGRRRNVEPSRWKGSLAWGTEFGPHPASMADHYGRGRRSGGYVLGPRTRQLEDQLAPQYMPLLAAAMDAAGWPVTERRTS
jgi:hypothetical protein